MWALLEVQKVVWVSHFLNLHECVILSFVNYVSPVRSVKNSASFPFPGSAWMCNLLSKCKRVKTSLSKRVKICKTTLKKSEMWVFIYQTTPKGVKLSLKPFQKSEIPLFQGVKRRTTRKRVVLRLTLWKSGIWLFWSGFGEGITPFGVVW